MAKCPLAPPAFSPLGEDVGDGQRPNSGAFRFLPVLTSVLPRVRQVGFGLRLVGERCPALQTLLPRKPLAGGSRGLGLATPSTEAGTFQPRLHAGAQGDEPGEWRAVSSSGQAHGPADGSVGEAGPVPGAWRRPRPGASGGGTQDQEPATLQRPLGADLERGSRRSLPRTAPRPGRALTHWTHSGRGQHRALFRSVSRTRPGAGQARGRSQEPPPFPAKRGAPCLSRGPRGQGGFPRRTIQTLAGYPDGAGRCPQVMTERMGQCRRPEGGWPGSSAWSSRPEARAPAGPSAAAPSPVPPPLGRAQGSPPLPRARGPRPSCAACLTLPRRQPGPGLLSPPYRRKPRALGTVA